MVLIRETPWWIVTITMCAPRILVTLEQEDASIPLSQGDLVMTETPVPVGLCAKIMEPVRQEHPSIVMTEISAQLKAARQALGVLQKM